MRAIRLRPKCKTAERQSASVLSGYAQACCEDCVTYLWKGDEAGLAVQVPTARSVCHGQKEWLRIVGSDGSHPDAAYAPQDPRYETLHKRLGINADNVQLTGIF